MDDTARAMVALMSDEEKAALVSGEGFWHTKALPRVGLRAVMVADGPHGLRKQTDEMDHLGVGQSVPAVCFPTAVTLASSWDEELLRAVGDALGEECLAEGVAVLLGPGINIKRSPLCGRNFEYFSEDPYLAGRLAAAFVKGVQGRGVGTSLKHYAVNNQEAYRLVVDAIADERTLREIYLPAFETVVKEANPRTVMCSYNKVNGVQASEDPWLLTRVLREEWGFRGLVVSDWGAVNDRVEGVRAGLDLEMPGNGGACDAALLAALADGSLSRAALDSCAARVVELVNASPEAPAVGSSASGYDEAAHHALARRAAMESAVLLKNDNAALPIRAGARVAVVGAFAKAPRYQGAGSSLINPTRVDAAYDALAERLGAAPAYAAGFSLDGEAPDAALEAEALRACDGAELIVAFAGLPPIKESEGFDRADLRLPDNQERLLGLLGEKAKASGARLVVVLSNGGPVEMPWLGAADAVLEAYLGGQAGGSATAALLLGEASPSGKLAETFPARLEDNPSAPYFPGDAERSEYREGLYVGYRYYDTADVEPLFPFGHGLSYTRFEYADLRLSTASLGRGQTLRVSCAVRNAGQAAGAEVVQLYVHDTESTVFRPEQELKGFAKVYLEPGETRVVELELGPRAFAYYDAGSGGSGAWRVEAGAFELRVGASSRDVRLRAALRVEGEAVAPLPQALRAALEPYYGAKVAGASRVGDEAFTALLGRPIPPRASRRPFTLNSPLGELKQTLAGRLIVGFIERFFVKVPQHDPASAQMVIRSFGEMPVRSLVLMGEGKLGWAHANAILALCNGHPLKAVAALRGRA